MQLQIAHKFIRSIGKETLQAIEKSIIIAVLYFINQTGYMKYGFSSVHINIKRKQILDKTLFHLAIGKSQTVQIETGVISLDSQITALINALRYFSCKSSLPIVCNIGLSYSSTKITTRCPVFSNAF